MISNPLLTGSKRTSTKRKKKAVEKTKVVDKDRSERKWFIG